MKESTKKEKYLFILKKAYSAFTPEHTPLKVKVVCVVIALLLSGLITLVKIAIR